MLTPSILTICVNYNNYDETAKFVGEVLGQKGSFQQRVVVVDNSEPPVQDSAVHALVRGHSEVRLYTPGKNLGYYGGAALGLQEYARENQAADWVIVCNTDIEFVQVDFLAQLCRLSADGRHAVIAPAIYSTLSKGDQNPYMRRRPTAARMHWYKWIFRRPATFVAYEALAVAKQRVLAFMRKARPGRGPQEPAESSTGAPLAIYAPHGSFVAFHRSYFEAGGDLGHGAFLFGEEIFVAETARRLGLRVTYDPRLRVIHREHAATGILKSRRKARYAREASAYCADEFFA